MTTISGPWLRAQETQRVFDALELAGFSAWFVGGCVRDALAGHRVRDVDIATDAEPADVIEAAAALGLETVPTGLEHGTVTVVSGETPHEVTTFRRDVATDGRRATVAYSTDIVEDARRRDFTMNALYADRTGKVRDPLGTGEADLAAGRVRFVGNARARIHEDYLRSLRYFRFLARFGMDGPDPDALDAIASTLDGLDQLSAERVGHEILRLLEAANPAPSVASMASAGVLSRVLPGANPDPLGPLVQLEEDLDCGPDPLRRLAAIGGEDLKDRLRLSRDQARTLETIRKALHDDLPAEECGYRLGRQLARDVAMIRAAVLAQPIAADTLQRIDTGASVVFPVTASDLMPDYEGGALGERLRTLETLWIQSGFRLTREALLSA